MESTHILGDHIVNNKVQTELCIIIWNAFISSLLRELLLEWLSRRISRNGWFLFVLQELLEAQPQGLCCLEIPFQSQIVVLIRYWMPIFRFLLLKTIVTEPIRTNKYRAVP